jgi:hypothetical protein
MNLTVRVVVILVAFVQAGALAQKAPAPPASVAGKWLMNLDTPHGKVSMTIEFVVDAKDPKKLSGTLASDHTGTLPIAGSLVDGKLAFAIAEGRGDLSFAGRLKDADTLVGTLTSQNGDLAATAVRVKSK